VQPGEGIRLTLHQVVVGGASWDLQQGAGTGCAQHREVALGDDGPWPVHTTGGGEGRAVSHVPPPQGGEPDEGVGGLVHTAGRRGVGVEKAGQPAVVARRLAVVGREGQDQGGQSLVEGADAVCG
jgi:hypothetical protein